MAKVEDLESAKYDTSKFILLTGAYLATHESRNFGGDTPEKGTTPNLKFQKFTDFDKQIVYIGVIDPPESKSGIIFELGPLLHCHFGYFCRRLEKNLEN